MQIVRQTSRGAPLIGALYILNIEQVLTRKVWLALRTKILPTKDTLKWCSMVFISGQQKFGDIFTALVFILRLITEIIYFFLNKTIYTIWGNLSLHPHPFIVHDKKNVITFNIQRVAYLENDEVAIFVFDVNHVDGLKRKTLERHNKTWRCIVAFCYFIHSFQYTVPRAIPNLEWYISPSKCVTSRSTLRGAWRYSYATIQLFRVTS